MTFDAVNRTKRTWLRELRKEKELTTREMAAIFGVSYQHYNDIENGRRNPSITLSMKIANYFDIPFEWFISERTKFIKTDSGENEEK